jgi:hypothetical protein
VNRVELEGLIARWAAIAVSSQRERTRKVLFSAAD